VQPVKVEINLPIPAAPQRRWSNGRFKAERVMQQVHAMAFAFRRCRKRDAGGKEYIVHVLARIPSGYRFFVKRTQWVTDDLAWVDALIVFNEAALRPFLDSGDDEWRAEVLA
jgi:hypothetical protein